VAIQFKKSSSFESARSNIEQHLFDSVFQIEKNLEVALRSVEQFDATLERFLDTLEAMYKNPATGDTEGVKSFPIGDGRYRVFYKISVLANNDFLITLIDIDDNKQSNLDRFPDHLITFDDET
jgi:hypothetical protein